MVVLQSGRELRQTGYYMGHVYSGDLCKNVGFFNPSASSLFASTHQQIYK